MYLLDRLGLGSGFSFDKANDKLSRKTFRYSIVYLSLLFGALLVDHYVRTVIGA